MCFKWSACAIVEHYLNHLDLRIEGAASNNCYCRKVTIWKAMFQPPKERWESNVGGEFLSKPMLLCHTPSYFFLCVLDLLLSSGILCPGLYIIYSTESYWKDIKDASYVEFSNWQLAMPTGKLVCSLFKRHIHTIDSCLQTRCLEWSSLYFDRRG